MRAITLLLLVVLAGCAAGEAETPVFIDDFITRSTTLACEPAPAPSARRSTITSIAAHGDTSFLVLYGEDREVVLLGPDLEVRNRITLDTAGPAGMRMPTGIALQDDSVLVVADQLGTKLQRFDLHGRHLGSIDLDFAPQEVHRTGDRLLVTPFVIRNYPQSMLFTVDRSGEAEPLSFPTVRYRDGLVNTFANTAQVATFPDGRIVVTHLLMVPFARVLTPTSPAPVRLPLPLPDGVHRLYGKVPTGSWTEGRADDVLFATIASAADPATGDLLYLTKTGRTAEYGSEKAIIRVDRELHYLRSHLLDINATRLIYLAGPQVAIIATTNDELYRCPIP